MNFPQTRLTLIQRLASDGKDEDWQRFLADYWGPVCRFAMRWGARDLDDAEEVAGHTFAVIWENRLLDRWVSSRSAKLRSLLCAVVRNTLRRRMREIFASAADEADGQLDLVISARPAAREASFEELREELHRALRKLGALGL